MYLAPYPQHTKQTRCNNNLNVENKNDFFRPIISNVPTPITNKHENYLIDEIALTMHNNELQTHHYDIERSSISTRNDVINVKKSAVQQSFQNDYYTMSFDNMNHQNNQEVNKFLNRNPVDTRRDNLEKNRNIERQEFLKSQGGMLSNFQDLSYKNTRKDKVEINSSNYIPMPRTLAIPKENI